jgi:hypothetical protein
MSSSELPPQQPLDTVPAPTQPVKEPLLPEAPLPSAGSEAVDRRNQQKELVRARLAAGGNYGEAAEAGDVGRRTVARWMSDPVFARSVSEARAEQVQAATGKLTGLADEAVGVLVQTMAEGTVTERLRAAQMVLEWGTRLRRDTDLEARLLEVESRLGLQEDDGDDTRDGAQ